MFALAETMYLCWTLGELLRMHSGCFCYRSNNVWFWKEQGLVSFAETKCQTCKHVGAHNTPLPISKGMGFSATWDHGTIGFPFGKRFRHRIPLSVTKYVHKKIYGMHHHMIYVYV